MAARGCAKVYLHHARDMSVHPKQALQKAWVGHAYLPLRLRLLMAEALGTERVPLLACSMTHRSSSSSSPSCSGRPQGVRHCLEPSCMRALLRLLAEQTPVQHTGSLSRWVER